MAPPLDDKTSDLIRILDSYTGSATVQVNAAYLFRKCPKLFYQISHFSSSATLVNGLKTWEIGFAVYVIQCISIFQEHDIRNYQVTLDDGRVFVFNGE